MTTFYIVLEWLFVGFLCLVGWLVYRAHQERQRENQERTRHRRREEEHHRLDIRDRESLLEIRRAMTQSLSLAAHNQANYTAKLGDYQISGQHRLPLPSSRVNVTEVKEEQKQLASGDVIPEPIDLTDLHGVWTPRPDRLLLAVGPNGPVTVPLDKSWHIALAGPTGGGKSNTLRLLMMQLVLFHNVYFINPAFAPIKANGEDWRPIVDRLPFPPARKTQEIEALFNWLLDELERREDAEQAGDFSWADDPKYVVIDEAKETFKRYPGGPDAVAALLRRARQYRMFVILAAQDMLIRNIGGDSGARECYRTSYYFGGDQTTARALLDVRGGIDESGLGTEGLVLLRALMSAKPMHSRVPLVSNEGLYTFMNIHPPFNADPMGIHDHSNVQNGSHHLAVNTPNRMVTGELMNEVNVPVKPNECPVNIHVNESERTAILAAARMQLRQSGGKKVVRTKVRDALQWHNGEFPKIKQVLDEEGF